MIFVNYRSGGYQNFRKIEGHTEGNTWLRHQMEIFSALLALCEGNSLVTGGFPSQKPVTNVFFDMRLNKRVSKQSRRWWFETLLRSL